MATENTTPSFSNIEGSSATTPGIKIVTASVPATITELPEPATWTPDTEWWQEEFYDYDDKSASRKAHKVSRGFRFHCKVSWDYLDKSNRRILTNLISQTGPQGYYVYFYPHSGQTKTYYECYISGYNISSYTEGIPVGYGPATIVLRGRELRAEIPVYETQYHFTDRDYDGAYDSADEIMHFTDSDFAGAYLATDKVGYFNDTTRSLSIST
jgi:hypothetical protein